MRHLLILAIVLLLSACGPEPTIPGVDGSTRPSVLAGAQR